MLWPGCSTATNTLFYVRARSGAWIESDYLPTIEEAQEEMARERWRGREPAIVKIETTETVVEEGE